MIRPRFQSSISNRVRCLLLAASFSAISILPIFAASSNVYYSANLLEQAAKEPSWDISVLTTRTDNDDEPSSFSGGEVRFLANTATAQQQLCGVFKSSDGKVLVVDGGVSENVPHLLQVLAEYGGTVDAWLITHPQGDHIGALTEILNAYPDQVEIRSVYFHLLDDDWYESVAPEDLETVQRLKTALRTLPERCLHGFSESAVGKNASFALSDHLSFRVLNDPLQLSGAYAVNDSSLMYDITLEGKHIIVLGDMGPDGGDVLLPDIRLQRLTCDYVVMAHHGQNGVRETFYRALAPKACIWSCPDWLFNASPGDKQLKTADTKATVNRLGITRNYCTKDGDITLR